MWLSTCKMSSCQRLMVSSTSSVCKCMIAVLCFTIVVTLKSLTHGYIFFTSTFFILSTIFFTLFSGQSQTPKKLITNHEQKLGESCSDAKVLESKYSEDENKTDDDDDDDDVDDNYVTRSSLSSENDGTISDEDSLIELELPTGHYLSHERYNKWTWMELLSESNSELATDEDNSIEIDISIGSITCPRFEIQA